MLSNLAEDVANCYRCAAEYQELARLATKQKDREFYLAREQDWLLLAQSYQLSEEMGQAIDNLGRRLV